MKLIYALILVILHCSTVFSDEKILSERDKILIKEFVQTFFNAVRIKDAETVVKMHSREGTVFLDGYLTYKEIQTLLRNKKDEYYRQIFELPDMNEFMAYGCIVGGKNSDAWSMTTPAHILQITGNKIPDYKIKIELEDHYTVSLNPVKYTYKGQTCNLFLPDFNLEKQRGKFYLTELFMTPL